MRGLLVLSGMKQSGRRSTGWVLSSFVQRQHRIVCMVRGVEPPGITCESTLNAPINDLI